MSYTPETIWDPNTGKRVMKVCCHNCASRNMKYNGGGGNCVNNKDSGCLSYGEQISRLFLYNKQWVNVSDWYGYSKFEPYIEKRVEDLFSDEEFEL